MRLLVLLRTAVFFLVGLCACVALTSNTRREEEPDGSSRLMTKATNQSVAPEGSKSDIDNKINELRGGTEERGSSAMRNEILDLTLSLGHQLPESPLHVIPRTVEGRLPAQMSEELLDLSLPLDHITPESSLPSIPNLIERLPHPTVPNNEHWTTWIKSSNFPWEDGKLRDAVFPYCVSEISPADMFQYLKVQHMYSTEDLQNIDPKLFWWLDYVLLNRGAGIAGTIAAPKFELFDNEKLFSFLVGKFTQKPGLGMSLAVVPLMMPSPDSRQLVVTLFEILRRVPTTTKLAEDMQHYLASNEETKPLVLNAWLQAHVSPTSTFNLLRITSKYGRIETIDNAMLNLWLTYVEKYWKDVNLDTPIEPFSYSAFLRLMQGRSIKGIVDDVLSSDGFRALFEKDPQPGFANHAGNLRKMWAGWDFVCAGFSPRSYFKTLNPSGTFGRDSLPFLEGAMYIELYRLTHTFTNKEIYMMLNSANSYETIVGLFQFLMKFWWMHEQAISMKNYLSDPSTVVNVAEMTPAKFWEIWLSERVDIKDSPMISKWFNYATSYYTLVNDNGSSEHAIFKVRMELKNKVPANQYAIILKAIGQDPRVRKGGEMSQQEGRPSRKQLKRAPTF